MTFVLFLSRPRGYYFVSGSYDRTARLWCTENAHPLRIFAGHLSDVNVRLVYLFVYLFVFNVNICLLFSTQIKQRL